MTFVKFLNTSQWDNLWLFYFSHQEKDLAVYSKLRNKTKLISHILNQLSLHLRMYYLFKPVSTILAPHLAPILRVPSA